MKKLLILDKDQTLVTPASGHQFVQTPDDQVLIPGVAEALARYREAGWMTAIASNQGGVASNKKTLGSAIDEMLYAMSLTEISMAMAAHSYEADYGEAIFIDTTGAGMYWRPITNRQIRFRKPGNGMIDYLATRISELRPWNDRIEVLFIGDRPEDQSAAQAAGVRFLWAGEWLESEPSQSK